MDHLNISQKLYGRERDLVKILSSFERIGRGQGEILLIPGYSGVGKTSRENELKKPARAKNSFFISGKFDKFVQNIPFYTFRQALVQMPVGDTLLPACKNTVELGTIIFGKTNGNPFFAKSFLTFFMSLNSLKSIKTRVA